MRTCIMHIGLVDEQLHEERQRRMLATGQREAVSIHTHPPSDADVLGNIAADLVPSLLDWIVAQNDTQLVQDLVAFLSVLRALPRPSPVLRLMQQGGLLAALRHNPLAQYRRHPHHGCFRRRFLQDEEGPNRQRKERPSSRRLRCCSPGSLTPRCSSSPPRRDQGVPREEEGRPAVSAAVGPAPAR